MKVGSSEKGITFAKAKKTIDKGGVVFGVVNINNLTDSDGRIVTNTIQWWEPKQTVTITGIEEYKDYMGETKYKYVVSTSGGKFYIDANDNFTKEGTFYVAE